MTTTQTLWRVMLCRDEVHIWRVQLDVTVGMVAQCATLLDSGERARAERFATDELRRRYIAAHGALRQVLAGYVDAAPTDVVLGAGPHGKPFLAGPATGSGIRFNLSHAGSWALIAVGLDREVGVDVERVRQVPDMMAVAASVLSPSELAGLEATPIARRTERFFRAWVRHEAYLKALGIGLGQDDGAAPPTSETKEPWQTFDLDPAPGYVGACVACQRTPRQYNFAFDRT